MNIAFTICSNNYLSQAKVLTDSIFTYSPQYKLFIILCDKKNDSIDYSIFKAEIVEVEKLGIKNFDWMIKHYNIVELNTAIKPFAFQYLLEYTSDIILYFDPDICIYQPLDIIEKEFGNGYFLLTPHSFAPLPIDGNCPDDTTFLNYGIYNLGFFGLRKNKEANKLLSWWASILSKHCFNIEQSGLFVDQLPMNLIPLYFNGVVITKHRGLNTSWWNLHERKIIIQNNQYYINNNQPLCFFHFSNYKLSEPKRISIPTRYSRTELINDTVLYQLYMEYYNMMITANQHIPNQCESSYSQKGIKIYIKQKIKGKVKQLLRILAKYYISI